LTSNHIRILLNDICDLIMNNLQEIKIMRYEFTIKPDGTPVTKSDVFIEELVFKFIEKRLSNFLFIGEESYNFSTIDNEDYIVLLDPIDGTENFCSGMKEWGVSFAIWEGKTFLGSFLLLPELGIRLISGDKVVPIESRITGLSSSISQAVINSMSEPGEYRITGCAVYNLYNVIFGSYKRFVNPEGAWIWDVLPGVMLALEQGCSVLIDGKPYNGEFLNPNHKYCVDIRR
jgi:myo-inositol-1(or 4)-monophosphatase